MYCKNIVTRGNTHAYATALMETKVFRENQLRLYTGVPVSDLAPADGNAASASQKGWITFLICQGDAVILTAYLPQEDWNRGSQPDGFPGLLTLELPETARVCSSIGQAPEKLLCKKRVYTWRFLGRPVLPEDLSELARAQMVERSCGNSREFQWIPTEYSSDCGLALGYVPQDGGTFLMGPWYSEETCANLAKILAWNPAGTPLGGRRPLAERLAQLPQETSPQQRRGGQTLFKNAAVLTYWLLQNPDVRPEELRQFRLAAGVGQTLVRYLALPLLDGTQGGR